MKTNLTTLPRVAEQDVVALTRAHKDYGDSWMKRGGVGAFMNLGRKWDRLEQAVAHWGYDVFKAVEEDRRPEGIMDDIRDLRRYLMLVEAELQARDVVVDALPKESEHQGSRKVLPLAVGKDAP